MLINENTSFVVYDGCSGLGFMTFWAGEENNHKQYYTFEYCIIWCHWSEKVDEKTLHSPEVQSKMHAPQRVNAILLSLFCYHDNVSLERNFTWSPYLPVDLSSTFNFISSRDNSSRFNACYLYIDSAAGMINWHEFDELN